jgi:hypothetical protein
MTIWITAVGVVIAAFLGLWGVRSVMIANNRQAWINSLRDDLAKFFTSIDAVHFRMQTMAQGGHTEDLEKQQEARRAVLIAHRTILMRLNMIEPLHQELEKALEPLLTVQGASPDQAQLGKAIRLARQVLKREWEVTKYGMFTAPVVYFKTRWKPWLTWAWGLLFDTNHK